MHYNVERRERRRPFGVRWQIAVATALWAERSDGASSNGRGLSNGPQCKRSAPVGTQEVALGIGGAQQEPWPFTARSQRLPSAVLILSWVDGTS